MKNSIFALILALGAASSLIAPIPAHPKTGEYVVGMFGIPEGNIDLLMQAGVSSAIISSPDIGRADALKLKKIPYTDVTQRTINQGTADASFSRQENSLRSAANVYDYYLGDDLKCKSAPFINSIRQRLGVKRGIVGVLKGLQCYTDYDILRYHYPLMRRQLSLAKMLNEQVHIANELHSSDRKMYLATQTHPQLWYQKAVELSDMNPRALLYPDGQVTRMLDYYSLASGADGFFLYNRKGLSGPWSRERLLGAAQAILETTPLRESVFNASSALFFEAGPDIFGTKLSGAAYDLYFVFCADKHTMYHPSSQTRNVELSAIVKSAQYKSVLVYSPLGTQPASKSINVSQDHSLVLIAAKADLNAGSFRLAPAGVKLYSEILEERADQLAGNLKLFGVSVPPLPAQSPSVGNKISALGQYIDNLNEIKRNEWLHRIGNSMPTDGDILNELYFKGLLKNMFLGNVSFNFYYK